MASPWKTRTHGWIRNHRYQWYTRSWVSFHLCMQRGKNYVLNVDCTHTSIFATPPQHNFILVTSRRNRALPNMQSLICFETICISNRLAINGSHGVSLRYGRDNASRNISVSAYEGSNFSIFPSINKNYATAFLRGVSNVLQKIETGFANPRLKSNQMSSLFFTVGQVSTKINMFR